MGIVSTEVQRDLNRTFFKTLYNMIKDQMRWKNFTTNIDTGGKLKVTYNWSNDVGPVTQWKGMRELHSWGEQTYTIESEKWQNAAEFKKDNFNDPDQRHVQRDNINKFAASFARHQTGLFFDLLTSTTALGPDGVTFFNAAHPIGDDSANTNSNLVSGTGVTEANILADWLSVKNTIRSWVVRGGAPLFEDIEFLKYTIVHPSDLEIVFRSVFAHERKSTETAADRPEGFWYKDAQLWGTQRTNTTNDWYVLIQGIGVMPFALMQVKKLVTKWHTQGDSEFFKDAIYYGGDGHYAFQPWYWEAAIKVNN
jgi:phage major head subunit gpT-like protein